jgi:CubicO group peptidase (beta-lactamase class C family)
MPAFLKVTFLSIFWASSVGAISSEQSAGLPTQDTFKKGFSEWQTYQSLQSAGWSEVKLKNAKAKFDELGSAAVMMVEKGVVVAAWGDIAQPLKTYSVRKSLLSLLIGNEVNNGSIKLTSDLAELQIGDISPLSPIEKTANIEQLLNSTSGVYHLAAKEPLTISNRPERDSHTPGKFWWYNNWGFNTLLHIYEQKSGNVLAGAFMQEIAEPLGMEDLTHRHIHYVFEPNKSEHPAYEFYRSARDLARIGVLVLSEGKWRAKQVLPSNWLRAATDISWEFKKGVGYGYMWWVNPGHADFFRDDLQDSFSGKSSLLRKYHHVAALGNYGQQLLLIPELDMVFVHRGYPRERGVKDPDIYRLLEMILAAKIKEPKPHSKAGLQPLKIRPTDNLENPLLVQQVYEPTPSEISLLIGEYHFPNQLKLRIYEWRNRLFTSGIRPEQPHLQLFRTVDNLWTSYELPLKIEFDQDKEGKPEGLTLTFSGRTLKATKSGQQALIQ